MAEVLRYWRISILQPVGKWVKWYHSILFASILHLEGKKNCVQCLSFNMLEETEMWTCTWQKVFEREVLFYVITSGWLWPSDGSKGADEYRSKEMYQNLLWRIFKLFLALCLPHILLRTIMTKEKLSGWCHSLGHKHRLSRVRDTHSND
jgi:hypothetical protein